MCGFPMMPIYEPLNSAATVLTEHRSVLDITSIRLIVSMTIVTGNPCVGMPARTISD